MSIMVTGPVFLSLSAAVPRNPSSIARAFRGRRVRSAERLKPEAEMPIQTTSPPVGAGRGQEDV
ncbi:hypothetical protein [Blastococcus sp. DSM 46786]|uniref:hypothetical protein n=1 Tax=Blastococcus sp. DSM 46786 TaxID=1798227 RepID=UPI000B80B381|nr:hypothetical protein [Blastococcus sp. DSM 46786]